MKHLESKLQISCINWYNQQWPNLEKLLFHVPNGGKRGSKMEAARFKKEGLRRGISDLIFLLPCENYHGVMMELKTPKGVVSDEQKEFLLLMEWLGYRVEVVRSFDRFKKIVESQINAHGIEKVKALSKKIAPLHQGNKDKAAMDELRRKQKKTKPYQNR